MTLENPPGPAPAAGNPPRPIEPPFVLPDSVEFQEDIVFARPDGVALKLQLFLPKPSVRSSNPPTLGVVWVHGGGWRNAAQEGRVLWRQAAHFASRGVPGINITYRFTPTYRFPAQLEDVQAGVRWVRGHARELGIDPERVAAVGESAGGHLAALLGTTDSVQDGISSRVQAVVAIYGVFDFFTLDTERGNGAKEALLGDDPDLMRRASPYYQADQHTPPTLLIHGTDDQTVPFNQSVRFQQRLREQGARVNLIPGPGGGHGHIHRPPFYYSSLEQMTDFILDVLGPI
ncbi:MAG TPA: alpha/beta hydrolase [Chloroflexota bacterium]|nr:alpha/beta hydrolase [Chloroflexota bacterium]